MAMSRDIGPRRRSRCVYNASLSWSLPAGSFQSFRRNRMTKLPSKTLTCAISFSCVIFDKPGHKHLFNSLMNVTSSLSPTSFVVI